MRVLWSLMALAVVGGCGAPSDVACADDPACHTGASASSPPSAEALAACQSACRDFSACRPPPDDSAACEADCELLSAAQQQTLAACGDRACDEALVCLGLDCFDDDDCEGNLACDVNNCVEP